jgi:FERM/RhoGEF/pleckstrin domain protein 2
MTREGSLARGSQGDHSSLRGGEEGGARSKTPPGTPKKQLSGKMLAIRVQMLDDSITSFQVQVIQCDNLS